MIQATTVMSLATTQLDLNNGGSGVTIITPAPAELFWPALAFFLLALTAGVVVFLIVRGVYRSRDELEQRLDEIEAENAELRRELDEVRSARV